MSEDKSPRPDDIFEMRHLVLMWGVCCMSPIMYLAVAAVLKQYLMEAGGLWPLSPQGWNFALGGLLVWVLILQGCHLFTRHQYKGRLSGLDPESSAFLRILKKRTIIMVAISELAVLAGFGLFLIQGALVPVFGAGIAAMFLYAQSHPRSALPAKN